MRDMIVVIAHFADKIELKSYLYLLHKLSLIITFSGGGINIWSYIYNYNFNNIKLRRKANRCMFALLILCNLINLIMKWSIAPSYRLYGID